MSSSLPVDSFGYVDLEKLEFPSQYKVLCATSERYCIMQCCTAACQPHAVFGPSLISLSPLPPASRSRTPIPTHLSLHPHTPTHTQVDYIRVFQAVNLGCSPKDFPTQQYLAW